jgi:outer membrane protein OmpA-like peptidoglycan-associated protein
MQTRLSPLKRRITRVVQFFLYAALTLGPFSLLDHRPALAQAVIATDDLVKALADRKPTNMSATDMETQKTVKVVLTDVAKISALDPKVVIVIKKDLEKDYVPTVDLAVYFDFDKAEITPRARATLDPLAAALARPSLKGATIVLAGHTDATGKADYNKELSQRRADAVKDYLVSGQRRPMPRQLLIAVGFGEALLKDKQDPSSAVNRRVQIINIGR